VTFDHFQSRSGSEVSVYVGTHIHLDGVCSDGPCISGTVELKRGVVGLINLHFSPGIQRLYSVPAAAGEDLLYRMEHVFNLIINRCCSRLGFWNSASCQTTNWEDYFGLLSRHLQIGGYQ